MSNVLKDKHGNIFAKIEERSNGHLVIHDKHGNVQGEYDPVRDVTKDKKGNKVGTGNLLATLVSP